MERIKELLKSKDPIKWLFTGDSITHGAYHTFGHRDYVQLFEERVRYELTRTRDVVIKTAVGGWTAADILNDLDWNVIGHNPDVVSLMVGINDANKGPSYLPTFCASLAEILDLIASETHALVILHTPNPAIPGMHANCEQNLPAIVDEIKRQASERDIPLVDNMAEFQKAWAEVPLRICSWMNEPVHPGVYGHRALARLLMKELGIWDENALSCRGFIL